MFVRLLFIVFYLFVVSPVWAADAPGIDDQTRAIAQELRCVVCQNLSVADSPSEMAQQMRGVVREQLQAGKTPQEVKDFFVSKYGEWVLLAPKTQGFSLLVWVLPFVVLILGIGLALWLVRRWSAKKTERVGSPANSDILSRVRNEVATAKALDIDPEDSSPHAQLLQERARLYTELKELEFDYQAGKLAESDYEALKFESENKAAGVLQQLDSLLPPKTSASRTARRQPSGQEKRPIETNKKPYRGWQFAAGGVFLLLFGLTLGIALTNSVRPRESTQDSMTGDFLTGTAGSESAQFLQQGKSAFAKQDWTKAIEAFKQALAVDPNLPEAHALYGIHFSSSGPCRWSVAGFRESSRSGPQLADGTMGKRGWHCIKANKTMPEQGKHSRSCFGSSRPVRRELRLKKYWLKCLRVMGKNYVDSQGRQPRRLQQISRSPVGFLSTPNSRPTWMGKLLFLSLLDLLTLPKALPWPSRRLIVRFFRSPTLSVPKTS
jgi:cytochrome c-type biogenesis protein CcmH